MIIILTDSHQRALQWCLANDANPHSRAVKIVTNKIYLEGLRLTDGDELVHLHPVPVDILDYAERLTVLYRGLGVQFKETVCYRTSSS